MMIPDLLQRARGLAISALQQLPNKGDMKFSGEALDVIIGAALEAATPTPTRPEPTTRGDTPWAFRLHEDRAFIIGAGDETIAARLAPDIAEHIVRCVNKCAEETVK